MRSWVWLPSAITYMPLWYYVNQMSNKSWTVLCFPWHTILLAPTTKKTHFFSSDESEEDEDHRKKFKIKIKPLPADCVVTAPSVDELKASIGNIALSPSPMVSSPDIINRRLSFGVLDCVCLLYPSVLFYLMIRSLNGSQLHFTGWAHVWNHNPCPRDDWGQVYMIAWIPYI